MKLFKAFIGKQTDPTHNTIPIAYYYPDSYREGNKYPFIIAFHGTGEFGDGTQAKLDSALVTKNNFDNLKKECDANDFILVTPQYCQNMNDWQPGPPAQWRQDVFNWVRKNLPVTGKVGITGYSGGGGDAWRFCTDVGLSPEVACSVIICGVPAYDCDFTQITKNKIPIRVFHAADDTTVGVAASRNQVQKVKDADANPSPEYTEYKTGGHGIWGTVYGIMGLFKELKDGGVIVAPPATLKVLDSFQWVGLVATFTDGSAEQATSVLQNANGVSITTKSGTYIL